MGYGNIISIMPKSIPTPPVNTVAPVISGTNVVGSTLTTTNGTWTGTAPISYIYQWKRDGVNIASATSSTYVLVQADATTSITCVVTATNTVGNASATSNALTIFDSNANSFISAETAAGVTLTSTQQNAINSLVTNLKAANIWSKFKAIYPVIGGTATAHKFNLVNPADTNAAFRLTFSGGWTHSANGMLPNGTNAWAQTYVVPNVNLINNSTHLSYYSRTTSSGPMIEIGSFYSGTNTFNMLVRYVGGGFDGYFSDQYDTGTNRIYTANTDSKGFYIGTRTTSIIHKGYKNGVQIGTTNTNASIGLTNFSASITIANRSDLPSTTYSNRECAFASIGDGLNDTEALALYNAVNAFEVALARNV